MLNNHGLDIGIAVCGSCGGGIISGQSRIICGGCSTDFHWTCMEEIFAETSRSRSKDQWLCSSCSHGSGTGPHDQNGQNPIQPGPGTGTKKRKKKKVKRQPAETQ